MSILTKLSVLFCFFGCESFEHALGNLQERIRDSEIVIFFWSAMQGRESDEGGDDGEVLACIDMASPDKAKTAAQLRKVIILFWVPPNLELDVFSHNPRRFWYL